MTERVRRRAVVSGLVQGVFFRDSTRTTATEHGLAGWARNLPDGELEVVLEGSLDQVDAVLAWLHHGPAQADVERVDVSPEPVEGLRGFSVRS